MLVDVVVGKVRICQLDINNDVGEVDSPAWLLPMNASYSHRRQNIFLKR